ncbi:MAG: PqqD family protein [Clostridiales bacterium]|nr:PqqD family protein [Clostridiales bacterium]
MNKKYCIRPGYILREIADEYVIIPVDEESLITNAVMSPNETAVFFWQAFQQPCTIEEAVQKGIEEYDATEDTIRSAAVQFVAESLNLRVLEEVD